MQKLLSYVRSACEHYDMINDNDKIAVGVSGGKDSLVLLTALCEMRRFYPKKYDIIAITLDPCFENTHTDYSDIEQLCSSYGIEYVIKRTELYHIIFETRKEKNPCSLCARMCRGSLHDLAKELGCNKIALGHHSDDAVQTFFMNLFENGAAECFSPVSFLSRKNLTMIRPLIFTKEKDIARVAKKINLPVVQSRCTVDGSTNRVKTEELIKELEKQYPALRKKVLNALQKGNISKW